ncbi:MAG: hemolysin family protein [Desulfuromonadales bacterium]|nr:hemolysin family protein [Desulfuromonadales bacterium]
MSTEQLFHLLGLGLLLLFSAFFSGSETALFALDRMRLNYLVQKKRRHADKLEELLSQPERLLGTLLVSNNVINIALSVFATTFLVGIFGEKNSEFLTILILTPLLLVFGEVTPKTYAARRAESVAFAVLPVIRFCMLLLKPLVWVVSGISRLVMRCLGREENRSVISEDEIRTILTSGEQSGTVAQEKHLMLHGVFDLSHIQVRDVMVPRPEMISIEMQTPFHDILRLIQNAPHSRFPVYEEHLDKIVGVIHAKDILRYVDRSDEFCLQDRVRAPYFVPESKRIETLLQSFRRLRMHMAIVVDEYGAVEGLVTMEDIVEQIVGEIDDEYDVAEVSFQEIAPRHYLIVGGESVRSVNKRFALELSEEHVTTMAGFLLRQFGTIPAEGAHCSAQGVTFVVRKVGGRRIEEIELILPEVDESSDLD